MGMATPALPRSEARKTPTIPGARRAADTSMERMRACACGEQAAGHAEVVDELSGARDEPRVLAATDASGVLGHFIQPSPRRWSTQPSPRGFALQLELPRLRDQPGSRPAPASGRPSTRTAGSVSTRTTLALALGRQTRAPVEGACDEWAQREDDEDDAHAQQDERDRSRDEDRVAPRRHGEGLTERKLHHGREDEAEHDGRRLEVELAQHVAEHAGAEHDPHVHHAAVDGVDPEDGAHEDD